MGLFDQALAQVQTADGVRMVYAAIRPAPPR